MPKRVRRVLLVIAATALLLASMAATTGLAAAKQPACQVENLNTGLKYTNLGTAVTAATTEDTIQVKGVCAGVLIAGKTLTLLGKARKDVPMATISGHLHLGTGNISPSIVPGHLIAYSIKFTGGTSGAIGLNADSSLVLHDSLVTGNTNASSGGGIDGIRAYVTLDNTDITNNTSFADFFDPGFESFSIGGSGGGISLIGAPSTLTLMGDSDFTGNVAEEPVSADNVIPALGGAIDWRGGSVTFDAWTGSISGNTPSGDQCSGDLTLPDSSICQ